MTHTITSTLPDAARTGGSRVDLAVFTCEGREHLLGRTVESFSAAVPFRFATRRVSADGPTAPTALDAVHPDVVVQHKRRGGYVRAIRTALRLIDSEYFFWLEDDWQFLETVDLVRLIELMEANPHWVQIRLSKTGRLEGEARKRPLVGDIFESTVGFSANPCLCRTAYVQAAFDALDEMPKGATPGLDGFEEAVSRWFAEHGLLNTVLDAEGVTHLGYLESTPRHWHMTASLAEGNATRVQSLYAAPPFWRRLWMLPKLARRFAAVAFGQLHDNLVYEVAFRMVTVPIDREARRG